MALRLGPYQRKLEQADFDYLGGHEYAAIADTPHTVFVLPLRHTSAEELADSVTHEAVHRVHRTWKDDYAKSTDKVRDRTAALMADPAWQIVVYRRLALELLRILKAAVVEDVLDGLKEGVGTNGKAR